MDAELPLLVIDQLQPGRGLNLLIAKHIAGISPTVFELPPVEPSPSSSGYGYAENWSISLAVPAYSTSMGLAWKVVERLRDKGWYFLLTEGSPAESPEVWDATFRKGLLRCTAAGATAPLAICRAALQVVRRGELT